MYNFVQLYKFVQSFRMLYNFIQLHKFVQLYNCVQLHNFVQCYTILYNCTIVHVFTVVQFCTTLYKFVQRCTNVYYLSFLQCCTTLYNFVKLYNVVQLCALLHNFLQFCTRSSSFFDKMLLSCVLRSAPWSPELEVVIRNFELSCKILICIQNVYTLDLALRNPFLCPVSGKFLFLDPPPFLIFPESDETLGISCLQTFVFFTKSYNIYKHTKCYKI